MRVRVRVRARARGRVRVRVRHLPTRLAHRVWRHRSLHV